MRSRVVLCLVCAFTLAGCGTGVEKRPVYEGAAAGAGAGMVSGYMMGGLSPAPIVIGAVAGAAAGAVGGWIYEEYIAPPQPPQQPVATLAPELQGKITLSPNAAPAPAAPSQQNAYKPFGPY
jgi:hypothetical protein